MAGSRLWIVDGHNIIFALAPLQRRQVSGAGAEARALLVERLERFAHRRGERVLVVFDGPDASGGLPGGAEIRTSPLLEVVYGRRGGGGADRRILGEARSRAGRGLAVTVVTDDIRTLAIDLPRSVRHLTVREFWLAHIEPPAADGEKPAPGTAFADIEQALLALEAEQAALEEKALEAGEVAANRGRATAGRHGARRVVPAADRSPASEAQKPASPEALRQEALRRKRARGRLRQERLLKRRSGSRRES